MNSITISHEKSGLRYTLEPSRLHPGSINFAATARDQYDLLVLMAGMVRDLNFKFQEPVRLPKSGQWAVMGRCRYGGLDART